MILSTRGQLNFEYLAITGVLLAILIPVIYTSLSTIHENYKLTQLDDIVSQLTYKANDVYKLGPGNKDELRIIVPSGITGATIAGNEIALHTILNNQNTSVRKYAESDLVGSLDTLQGEYFISVKALNHSLVRIGSGPLILEINPSCIGAPSFANPPTITLRGDDFFSSALLLKNDAPFDTALYQIVDPTTIIFTANPTEFSAQPGGTPYNFTVRDGTKTSNSINFLVYPSPNLCP